MAKEIPLTQGYVAIVDDEDYELVSKYKWHVTIRGKRKYAMTNMYSNRRNNLVYMHRFLMKPPKGYEIDHINGDGLDNRRSNLRIVTRKQNSVNSTSKSSNSRFKGVIWDRRLELWRARITNNHKHIWLGCYDNEYEAAIAYDKKAYELWGEYAKTNFPLEVFLNTEVKTTLEKRKTSKYRGVSKVNGNKWRARIPRTKEKPEQHIGIYENEEIAYKAVCYAEKILLQTPNITNEELREKVDTWLIKDILNMKER